MQPESSLPPAGNQPPVPVRIVPEAPQQAPRRKRSVWMALVVVFLLMVLCGSVVLNLGLLSLVRLRALDSESRVQQRYFSHQRGAPNKVVIMSVEGAILSGEGFFKQQIDSLRKDQRVKAVVLRVNSPGGLVSASDYMLHHLKKLSQERDLPVVVSMGGIAASGGYYVSMAVGDRPDTIFAEPTTFTGSIGVIIPHYDLSKLLEKWGVEEDSIKSHELKGMGSFARKMTPEEEAIFQGLVDESFARFKEVVKGGRPKFRADPKALDALATGQIYTADQALASGLVDKIGFLEDAVDRAVALAGLAEDKVEVVRYEPQPTLADLLFGADAKQPGIDLAAILDATVPRAYYLCTRLPPLVSSGPAAR